MFRGAVSTKRSLLGYWPWNGQAVGGVAERHEAMQDVHITISAWKRLQPMVEALEEQFAAQSGEVAVLDYGYTQKQGHGYIVVEWSDESDEAFLAQLQADERVLDYSVFTVPSVDDYPFGVELATPEEPQL